MDIKEKVALITGGASGLGEATTRHLVAEGAKVAILDLDRQKEKADELIKELGADKVAFFAADVTIPEEVQKAIDQTVEKFGALHVNVNCAGLGLPGKTLGREGPHDLDAYKFVINVNLIGTFNVLRLSAAAMDKNEALNEHGEKGLIVNTASVAAFDGQIGQAAYSSSKGGLVGMTLPIARDLGPHGIRINTIAPGIFNTPLMAMAPDKVRDPLIAMTQFPKRLGNPPEFAQLVAHMMENPYLNGETIRLDGGIRMAPR